MTPELVASSPAATAVATNIIARNKIPLPRNTDAKKRSSYRPNPSRTTPMNHRKLMPANGISFAAVAIPPWLLDSQADESCIPSGILSRMRTITAPNSRANTTPASAAARGVFS